MLHDNNKFQNELNEVIGSKNSEDIFKFMERNIVSFFSTEEIFKYYQEIRNIDISYSTNMMPILIKGWLAFLSGDNAGFMTTVRYIDEAKFRDNNERSFYYSLIALTGFSIDYTERLKYGKLSIDVLPDGDKSIFMGNAKLTYGQLLSGFDKYRQATEVFNESYQIFNLVDVQFLAVIAFVNKTLNEYKLGEVSKVIDECSKVLRMHSRFKEEAQGYWNIINLPLGMCYFDLNKPSLAIRHLQLAKASIDSMGLLHMHGIPELYLFKSYFILNDENGMEDILRQSEINFGKVHYTMTDLLISMFRIMFFKGEDIKIIQPDIERFEVEYMKSGEKIHFMFLEILGYLKLKGYSNAIKLDDILKGLRRFRYIGLVSYTQMFLILLAELHFDNNKENEAKLCLKEAVDIYNDYGISVNFSIFPMKSFGLLKSIDKDLYKGLENRYILNKKINKVALLSSREKEVMDLVALGKSNDEISKTLFISVGTVKWHINNIFGKLEVKNRIEAVDKAKNLGEIS